MSTEWRIYNLKRQSSDGLVLEVEYGCEVTLDGRSDYTTGKINITGSSTDSNFTSFENLNEAMVLGWITSSIDTSSIESDLIDKLNNISNGTHLLGTNW